MRIKYPPKIIEESFKKFFFQFTDVSSISVGEDTTVDVPKMLTKL